VADTQPSSSPGGASARAEAVPRPLAGDVAEGSSRLPTRRELVAERVAAALDVPFTVAGLLFVLVLVADRSTPPHSAFALWWTVASWALWSLFVVEFALRLVIARSSMSFLRHNWWQVVFLFLPFLRFLRAFSRVARLGRALTTSVRTSRTAGRKLSGRVGWLLSITAGVIIASTEVLFEFAPDASYAATLHDVALAAISGEPLPIPGSVARWLEVGLALYATVFFGALAGALGAFFLERHKME
jgi:voltage-gated potassium channel